MHSPLIADRRKAAPSGLFSKASALSPLRLSSSFLIQVLHQSRLDHVLMAGSAVECEPTQTLVLAFRQAECQRLVRGSAALAVRFAVEGCADGWFSADADAAAGAGLTGQRQVLELAYQPELASTPRLPAAGYPTAEALP